MFQLPDQLPANIAELDELADQARAEINVIQARHAAGEELSTEDVERLQYLLDSRDTVTESRDELAAAEQSQTDNLNSLLDRAAAANAPAADENDGGSDDDGGEDSNGDSDVDASADIPTEAEAKCAEQEQREPVAAASKPVSFAGRAPTGDLPADTPAGEKPKGWELLPTAPKYAEFSGDATNVGAREIAESIASVKSSSGQQKTGVTHRGGKDFAIQPIAKLARPQKGDREITTAQELLAEMDRVTSHVPGQGRVSAEALTAAGGWQAPSEQIYTFCAVPPAVNLLSVPEPENPIQRGGVRYPIESDMSALLTDFAFQNHFTETELEAVDGDGDPTAIKTWSEIPAPTEFLEFRLGVIQYAVKVGILHQQGWPESVEHDVERLMVRHQHGISWRTINDIVDGSGVPKVVPTDTVLGATSSILNGLGLQAINLRLDKGLDTDAPIEGFVPVWFREVMRADLALRDGLEALEVSDAQINGFLTRRNIYLQYVDDWQTRGDDQPGNLNTLRWPGYVDVALYPAGTWFRSLNPVVTFGVQYPMDLLKFNQYSHGFFEDAIAVGKRCNKSIIARVPLCVNGAVGAREQIECTYKGATTLTATVTVTDATDGTFTLAFANVDDSTSDIAYNAAKTAVATALAGVDDGYSSDDFTVTGDAGGPYTITYPAELGALSADGSDLTGGTVAVS